jgi:hypothetical protein
MKVPKNPQDMLPEHQAAGTADRTHMSRNADLTQPVDPLVVTVHKMLGWERETEVILPEITDVVGPSLTYAQIARDEIPQLFERVGFGGVNFGVTREPESPLERARLVPITRDHLPYIIPERIILVDVFRIYVALAIEQLKEDPRRDDPRHRWHYIRCGRQILAALEVPAGDVQRPDVPTT